jgi:very-short-patch-repair endonuclease
MRLKCSTPDEDVAVLAARQHGVVARYQLLGMGFERSAIQRRVAAGRFHRVHQGVYAVGHPRVSSQGRLMAAVLACGPAAVLSHWHAAALWGLHRTSRRSIDVTSTRRLRGRPGIAVHLARRLDPVDCTIRDGIPVTSVARTLLDFAEVAVRRHAERAVDEAERRRLFDLDEVDAVCARNGGRRGIKPLRAVIAEATEPPATRMELERRFAEFCRDAGLPRPAFNAVVAGHVVDAVWPKSKLVVELDSWAFHGGRKAFEDDRKRDVALQVAHYRVVRVTWRRLTREAAAVAEDLRALLT